MDEISTRRLGGGTRKARRLAREAGGPFGATIERRAALSGLSQSKNMSEFRIQRGVIKI